MPRYVTINKAPLITLIQESGLETHDPKRQRRDKPQTGAAAARIALSTACHPRSCRTEGLQTRGCSSRSMSVPGCI